MAASAPIDIATRFAAALDAEDYPPARALLADECVYTIRGTTHKGPDAIIASYREAGEEAARMFDEIVYVSKVDAGDGGWFIITYFDRVRHAGLDLHYTCEQRIRIEQGLIRQIEHRDIPEEREKLESFKRRVGL